MFYFCFAPLGDSGDLMCCCSVLFVKKLCPHCQYLLKGGRKEEEGDWSSVSENTNTVEILQENPSECPAKGDNS